MPGIFSDKFLIDGSSMIFYTCYTPGICVFQQITFALGAGHLSLQKYLFLLKTVTFCPVKQFLVLKILQKWPKSTEFWQFRSNFEAISDHSGFFVVVAVMSPFVTAGQFSEDMSKY